LFLFGETEPPYSPASNDDSPFVLAEQTERRVGRVKLRAGQQQFRFNVIKQYGCKCVLFDQTPAVDRTAHIRGKASGTLTIGVMGFPSATHITLGSTAAL
jgi:hypothetical protein